MATAKRRNVTFELPEEEFMALLGDTANRGTKSHHQRAKEILLDYYNDQARIDAEQLAAEQAAKIDHLTETIRKLAYVIITNVAGDGSDEASDTANAWIIKNMPKEPD